MLKPSTHVQLCVGYGPYGRKVRLVLSSELQNDHVAQVRPNRCRPAVWVCASLPLLEDGDTLPSGCNHMLCGASCGSEEKEVVATPLMTPATEVTDLQYRGRRKDLMSCGG